MYSGVDTARRARKFWTTDMVAIVGSAQCIVLEPSLLNDNSQPSTTRYCVKPLGLLQGRAKLRGASERVSKDEKEGEQLEGRGGRGQPGREPASGKESMRERKKQRGQASCPEVLC